VRFACLCTRHKVEVALLGLGRDELAIMKAERDEAEATCEFCRQTYRLTGAELGALIDRLETAERS
jgi:molecular chaperone Hsp33